MQTPRLKLKTLGLSLDTKLDAKQAKNVLDIFSRGTGGVEKLEYETAYFLDVRRFIGPVLSEDVFEKIISRKKPSLSELSFHFDREMSDKEMDKYLPLFLECPALEELYEQPWFDNVLGALGRRAVRYHWRSKILGLPNE